MNTLWPGLRSDLRAEAAVDPDHISELFAAFGRVALRNMFGGAGIYADGVMFGLMVDDVIYLKADADTFAAFEREGCGRFTYDTKRGERALKSYWRMPDRLYDEPEELASWAKAALAAARRAAAPARGGKRIKR
jgi:DNA transformation protein and related proteins